MATQEIKVTVDEEAITRAAATIREAGKVLSEALKHAQALTMEPWRTDGPDGPTVAYLDDRDQVRHCSVDLVAVPDSWRQIFLKEQA